MFRNLLDMLGRARLDDKSWMSRNSREATGDLSDFLTLHEIAAAAWHKLGHSPDDMGQVVERISVPMRRRKKRSRPPESSHGVNWLARVEWYTRNLEDADAMRGSPKMVRGALTLYGRSPMEVWVEEFEGKLAGMLRQLRRARGILEIARLVGDPMRMLFSGLRSTPGGRAWQSG